VTSRAGTLSLPRSPTKRDPDLIASPRNEIGAQAWTAVGVWAPAVGCWLLLYWGAIHMDSPAAQLTMPMSDWSAANWLAVFAMWAVMMAAMMLPSIAPMVL